MRVQGALIWNISPLMSSAEPPIMYSTSLWSIPYEAGAPTRLLYAQERAFLRDLRTAIDKRVEHKIASARRFAVSYPNETKLHGTRIPLKYLLREIPRARNIDFFLIEMLNI